MWLTSQVQNKSFPKFSGLKEVSKKKKKWICSLCSRKTISRIYTASKWIWSMQVSRTSRVVGAVEGLRQTIWAALLEGQETKQDLYSWTVEKITAAKSKAMKRGQKAAWWNRELNKQATTSSARSQATSIYKNQLCFVC